MSEKKPFVVGGDTNNSLSGQYKFDLSDIFKQAWHLTQQHKWLIVQMVLIVLCIAVGLVVITLNLFGIEDLTQIPADVQRMIDIMLTVLLAPFFTAIMATGVNHAVGGKGRVSHLFNLLPKAAFLGLTSLLIALLVQIGLMLLIIPGLYLTMATSFALLIVAEKQIGPTHAILLSIKVVNRYWLEFAKIYLIFALLFFSVILTFGVSMIWVAPMYYHVQGILYRDLFGIKVIDRQDGVSEEQDESTFNA